MTGHPLADLGAYALGALDEQERGRVEAHTRECAACSAEVSAYSTALSAYAAAVDRPGAPALREQIVARHRRGGNAFMSWLRRPVPAALPIALTIALVASLASAVVARREAEGYAAVLAGVADGRVVALQNTGELPGARGSLVIPQGGSPYLILEMPAPPAGRAWEAWVLRDGRPIAAGVASVREGVLTVLLATPFLAGDGVAVTHEPAGGVAAPTSPAVLALPRT